MTDEETEAHTGEMITQGHLTNEVGGGGVEIEVMTDASRAPTSRRELLSSLLSQKAGSL